MQPASRALDEMTGAAHHARGLHYADRARWAEAYRHFRHGLWEARHQGDAELEARCLMGQAEVHMALGRWEDAREGAERALVLFDLIASPGGMADASRLLGVVFRETSRPALAESRLRCAVEIALSSGSPRSEAAARHELAELYRQSGRSAEALEQVNAASALSPHLATA